MKRTGVLLLLLLIPVLSGCLHGGAAEGNLSGAAADPDRGGEGNVSEVGNETGGGTDAPEPYTDAEVTFIVDGEEREKLAVEVAETAQERFLGLRNRRSLPDGTGMLFVYPSPQEDLSFTMQDTHVPLDIIFVDRNMTVLNVEHGEPEVGVPEFRSKDYPSDGPAQFVVEAEQGYANETGVSAGDELVIRR